MKPVLFALLLFSFGLGAAPLFRSELNPVGLSNKENETINHLKDEKVIKMLRVKNNYKRIISIDGAALRSGRIEAELIDGEKEVFELNMKTNGKDSVWKGGLPNNRGNFKLTKTKGAYRGYIYISGRYFIISSISNRNAMIYEQDLSYKCPVRNEEARNVNPN